MAGSVETTVAERWLYARLAGDAGPGGVAALAPGGVHANLALRVSAYPYVTFTLSGRGRPLAPVPGARIWVALPYDVTAILDRNDQEALDALAARIETRLQLQGGTVAGGTVVVCEYRAPINYPELDGDRIYLHYGATYELKVQVSA